MYSHRKRVLSGVIALVGAFGAIGVFLAAVAAWITHVVVAISVLVFGASVNLSLGYGFLLVVGVFMPPVGVIHGIGVWFGAW
jgi:hypothetical protein